MKIYSKSQLFSKNKEWYWKMNNENEVRNILNYLAQNGFIWNGSKCKANELHKVFEFNYPWYLEYSDGTLSYNIGGEIRSTQSRIHHIHLNF